MEFNRRYFIIFSFIILFILFGCATSGPLIRPNQSSRQEYISNHPELSSDIKQAILNCRVIKGMTKEDVKMSWGEPTRVKDFSRDPNAWWYDKYGEGWWYKPFPLSIEPTRFVKFKKDIVDYTSEDYK